MEMHKVMIEITDIEKASIPGRAWPGGVEKEYVTYRIVEPLSEIKPTSTEMMHAILRTFEHYDPTGGGDNRFCLHVGALRVGQRVDLYVYR